MGSDAETWSYKAGERGRNRVRAHEPEPGGTLRVEWYETDPATGTRKRRRKSLGHRDREKAKAAADKLAGRFAEMDPGSEEALTLGGLFDIFTSERTPEVGESRRKEHRRVADAMCRYFGEDRDVSSLNLRDWTAYKRERGTGAIDAHGHAVPEGDRNPVGPRAVGKDLSTLRTACRWAVGGDLLRTDPTEGYSLPERNTPRRPTLSHARYRAMLEVATDVGWRFRTALILCHETGHRIGSVRQLRWADVEPLDAAEVRWRGSSDKIGHEHETDLTGTAVDVLREARKQRPGVGQAWVLPSPVDPSRPVSRHRVRDWWLEAEEVAGLEHVEGLGWHGLRRKFADDLKPELPLKDLAAAGGWKQSETVVRCYQSADRDRIREALESR